MPTAVERHLDSFLKFDGAAEQLKLDGVLLKIDDDLIKLSNAGADDFLKLEHDIKLDFHTIGEYFHKVGTDFQQVGTAEHLFEQFVVKLSPDLDTDFRLFDHKIESSAADLKIVGLDFLKLDTAKSVDAFNIKLDAIGQDFLKLSDDMAANADAFLKLGQKWSGGEGDKTPLEKVGGDLLLVGRAFDVLSDDFIKLHDALTGGGGGAGKPGLADSLTKLFDDFHVLDGGLAHLGADAKILIGLLKPAEGNSGPPIFDDGSGDTVTLSGISHTNHHEGD